MTDIDTTQSLKDSNFNCCLVNIHTDFASTGNIQPGDGSNSYILYLPIGGTTINIVGQNNLLTKLLGKEIEKIGETLKPFTDREVGTLSSQGYLTVAIRSQHIYTQNIYGSTNPFWPFASNNWTFPYGIPPKPTEFLVIRFVVRPGTFIAVGPRNQVNVNLVAECN